MKEGSFKAGGVNRREVSCAGALRPASVLTVVLVSAWRGMKDRVCNLETRGEEWRSAAGWLVRLLVS